MKTPEDEAFDDIARKQGGGGFKAKQAMAANKLWDKPSVAFDEWWNGDNDESTNPFRLESGAYWAWAGWKAALAQPAQEPVAHVYSFDHEGRPLIAWDNAKGIKIGDKLYTAPLPAHCQCIACKDGILHASDCAVHNGPAYPAGPCDCGVAQEKNA